MTNFNVDSTVKIGFIVVEIVSSVTCVHAISNQIYWYINYLRCYHLSNYHLIFYHPSFIIILLFCSIFIIILICFPFGRGSHAVNYYYNTKVLYPQNRCTFMHTCINSKLISYVNDKFILNNDVHIIHDSLRSFMFQLPNY